MNITLIILRRMGSRGSYTRGIGVTKLWSVDYYEHI